MKYVQIGILVCLASITVLLGAIYLEQRSVARSPDAFGVVPDEEVLIPETVPMKPTPVRAEVSFPRSGTPKPRPVQQEPGPQITAPSPEPLSQQAVAAPALPTLPPEPAPAPAPIIEEPAPMEARTVTLHAGLPLVVRLSHTLSTERNEPGDDFQAVLDEPLIVDGLVVAEKGAQADGRVVRSDRAGRIKGRSYLALELTTLVTRDGQPIAIETQLAEQEGPNTQKKDAKRIGIGAGVGAALGAIFGGGKGAAVGAATGAGAGAGTTAVTRGEPVVLRPETRLEFRLNQPVAVTEQR